MKTLVVYESMFGNTEQVARAIADGLAPSGPVEVYDVSAAPVVVAPDVALVVAGGPTHAFSMTRPQTRADAIRQGATRGGVEVGLREWLARLSLGETGTLVATFDTRVAKVRHLPGSAARKAARLARGRRFELVAAPQSFYVNDVRGPLLEGEVERATDWGRDLGRAAARRTTGTGRP